MNLYLLQQDANTKYDTYDAVVVAAETEEDAKTIHPNSDRTMPVGEAREYYDDWCAITEVKSTLIGRAIEGTKRGVILSSFNAG